MEPDPRVWPSPYDPERYQRDECQLDRISALEPCRRVQRRLVLQTSGTKMIISSNVQNAMMTPYWNVNAHGVHYIVRGSGEVQVVDDNGNTVFDGQVRAGQVITVPQNFAVVKKASAAGMEWVTFKTNDNARINQLAGKMSAIRSMPVDVVANSYQVSREEARRLKENRQEVTVLSPRSRSRYNITEGSE
ncbi:hypothetical protein GH714_021347 [Hevea brasiliensis]|uniref:Cupin type-1 domain-containing protein n=1 Tax=Hevea brasiliensis TaxID=3981 RepID=A0A6A6MP20_HEVBR|nr:hypothetical protein GH714_021347 [Hevea brasiliensis]